MSITEELRKWVHEAENYGVIFVDPDAPTSDIPVLLGIADRIDERYHRDMATAQQVGINEGEDAAMRDGWVKLPVDADGEVIHIGDVMEWSNGSFTVHELKLTEDGWQTWDSEHGYTVHADECIRHHQPDSWERIIKDAVSLGYADYPTTSYEAELVERCKKLAGESE